MDILYPVRPGDENEELRWSLRTLEANYPHGTIWVVGYKPTWLKNVNHIPGNTQRCSQANIYHNLLTACQHPETPDELVVFNDDFFITQPIDRIPVTYRGTLRDHIELPSVASTPKSWWARSLRTTLIVLQALGYTDPLSYDLHTPLPINKHLMRDTLERFACIEPSAPPQWRTLYGNINNIGGVQHKDCKASRRTHPRPAKAINEPFHSTNDSSWQQFRHHFATNFPDPSRYEIPRTRMQTSPLIRAREQHARAHAQ